MQTGIADSEDPAMPVCIDIVRGQGLKRPSPSATKELATRNTVRLEMETAGSDNLPENYLSVSPEG